MAHRITTVVAAAAVFGVLAGGSNAVAANLIDSRDIKNNSVKSIDIKNGTLQRQDMGPGLKRLLDSAATKSELAASNGALDARLDALEAQDSSGANTNFKANPGSAILDDTTVGLTATEGGTSVEIANLDVPVQAGQTVSFTYALANGAVYGAGSPRVFYEIAGQFYNTFDGDPTDKGVDNKNGTFTKSVTVPVNGRVGGFGVVYDGETTGTVTVGQVKVGDYTVKFR
ncbi:hypothetical protein [Nocardioides litoris]|uniref:hypothetical protein n=1 Tax=Nocardioides litoris TaxID=1926648 RepID=UPI0011233CC7|nr:hypothetical protein [Nocardioides litoris]